MDAKVVSRERGLSYRGLDIFSRHARPQGTSVVEAGYPSGGAPYGNLHEKRRGRLSESVKHGLEGPVVEYEPRVRLARPIGVFNPLLANLLGFAPSLTERARVELEGKVFGKAKLMGYFKGRRAGEQGEKAKGEQKKKTAGEPGRDVEDMGVEPTTC